MCVCVRVRVCVRMRMRVHQQISMRRLCVNDFFLFFFT